MSAVQFVMVLVSLITNAMSLFTECPFYGLDEVNGNYCSTSPTWPWGHLHHSDSQSSLQFDDQLQYSENMIKNYNSANKYTFHSVFSIIGFEQIFNWKTKITREKNDFNLCYHSKWLSRFESTSAYGWSFNKKLVNWY